MSVYLSDVGIRVQRISISCDSCRKQATDAYDVPQVIMARRVTSSPQDRFMTGGPMYAIDGTPSVEEAEAAFVKQGWTVRVIGEMRFFFCPNCKEQQQ